MMRRLAAAEAFPTANPTSTGSVRHPQGARASRPQLSENHHPAPAFIHQSPAGKSNRTSAASRFSDTPEDLDRLAEKPPPKEILAKRLGELRSRPMNMVVNSPDPARSRRSAERSFLQQLRFAQHPLFPRNPLFPASGPASGSLNGPHLKSKFLATSPHPCINPCSFL